MNEKSKSKLRGRIQNFVRLTEVVNGEISLWDSIGKCRELADFTNNLISNTNHVESNHLYMYLSWEMLSFVRSKSISNLIKGNKAGVLKDFLPKDDMERFEAKLFYDLSNIPHKYVIRYQLEEITKLPKMLITISKNVKLEVTDSSDAKPFYTKPPEDSNNLEPVMSSYLLIDVTGFCCHDLNSSGVQESITIIKVFIFFIWNSNTILNMENSSLNSSLNTFTTSVIKNKFLQISNDSDLLIKLPSDLTHFLNNFKFKNEEITNLDFSGVKKLLESESNGAKRIKSAIEWYIDSTFNKSDSVKFIQTCIGLESLLGDERQDAPLSYTLADRCSYLIAESFEDRERIRKSFRDMYKVRSKLVHGTSRNITETEAKHYTDARYFLNKAIMKELDYLQDS